jgi:hypothetical protein
VVKLEEIEPQARRANFQLHYLEKQEEHNKAYPETYIGSGVDGVVHIPKAQFEVTVTLGNGSSEKGRSGVFIIDRRPKGKT